MANTGYKEKVTDEQLHNLIVSGIEKAYTAILADLFLANGKLARFLPMDDNATAFKNAHNASLITNYAIFKQNRGWELLQTWFKSALLWKNGVVRWDYIEDFHYKIEEYDEIDQDKLDLINILKRHQILLQVWILKLSWYILM